MFRVGTGLDSQILGDFEIISQIRSSFAQSKELMYLLFMERLVNAVIQASKNKSRNRDQLRSHFFCFCTIYHKNVEDISVKNILNRKNRKKYLKIW
jgi:glutamyl-tRNA reductase